MKNILVQLSSCHLWANTLLLDTLNTLPEEVQKAPVKSSFDSLLKTALHLYESEKIWWERLQQTGAKTTFSKAFSGSIQDFSADWLRQNTQIKDWIADMDEKGFEKVLYYHNLKGEPFEQPVFQILLHLFNHATYHRGQMVTILRQLDVENIPATDFIIWSRKVL